MPESPCKRLPVCPAVPIDASVMTTQLKKRKPTGSAHHAREHHDLHRAAVDPGSLQIPIDAGQGFRFEAGRHSDLMSDTVPI
jgi:hypothetical protein